MIKFGQKMEVYDPFIWKRGLVFNESEEPIGFGPNIQCPGIVNDTIRKSRLMDLKQRRNAKKVRKESKNVVNVTVTEDHEYNIEDVLQNLELSEASSKKSKRKKKKKGDKKSAHEDKEQNSAQDQDPDPDPVCKEEEPIMIKNAFSGPECSTFAVWSRYILRKMRHIYFFCESEEKRCPTCRAKITGKVRVFS